MRIVRWCRVGGAVTHVGRHEISLGELAASREELKIIPRFGDPHELPNSGQCRQDRAAHDVLSFLRRREARRRSSSCTAGRSCRSPGAGSCLLRGLGLSRHSARHARLRTLERLSAPRGLCAGRDRRRHGRAAGALGREKAVWVGHDWGSAGRLDHRQEHPERCHGVACLCVPYHRRGFARRTALPLADRAIYPARQFPAAQWDYQLFYRESFDKAVAGFERNVGRTVSTLFRKGDPAGRASRRAPPSCARRRLVWPGGSRRPICRATRTS